MLNAKERLREIEQVVGQLQAWQGSLLRVIEEIARVPGSLDRHSTTRSCQVMELEQVAVSFSGAALMLMGKAFDRDVSYQVCCDLLTRARIRPSEIQLSEQLNQTLTRLSTLQCLAGLPEPGPGPDETP